MSNEENKITTVEKSAKVELGKRLAKISKEAKERKARLRKSDKVKKEILDYIDFKYVVGGVMLIAAVGGLYFAYKEEKKNYSNTKQKCNIENL